MIKHFFCRNHLWVNLFLLLAIVVCIGCKKSASVTTSINGTFYTSSTVQLSPVTMYVANRVITDEAIIRPYTRARGCESYFVWGNQPTAVEADTSLTIRFFDNDSVSYTSKSFYLQVPYNYTARKVTENDGNLLIENIDSFILLSNGPFNPNRCDTLFNAALRTGIHSYDKAVGTNSYLSITKLSFRLEQRQGQLYLNRVSYAYNTSYDYAGIASGRCSSAGKNRWGTEKSNIVAGLLPGDTVVLQPSSILLIQQ